MAEKKDRAGHENLVPQAAPEGGGRQGEPADGAGEHVEPAPTSPEGRQGPAPGRQPPQPEQGEKAAQPGDQAEGARAELPSHQQLTASAQMMGLDPSLVGLLMQTFGSFITQALLAVLSKKGHLQAQAPDQAGQPRAAAQPAGVTAQQAQMNQARMPARFGLDLSLARTMLVALLDQHRQDILGWLTDQEQNLLNSVIQKIQGQSDPNPQPAPNPMSP